MNIEIISGSPRQGSLSIRVAKHLVTQLSQQTTHNIGMIDVREWPVPVMLQNVISSVEDAPDDLKPLATRMFAAHAFVLVTPEYNGSYTPALKNLLDHFPKQTHKAFGISTASPGIMGGIRATQQMQLLINGLFGIGSPSMLVVSGVEKKFDAEGTLIDTTFKPIVDNFIREFVWLAEHLWPVA